MKLALEPIPYYWPRETVLAFYRAVALSAVDVVYLGETVCSRRHELRLPDWLDLAHTLAAAGKEVVLSTQALIESESDLKMLRRIAGNGRFLVEANDMGAVRLLEGKGPFVAGSHLNVYNPRTLAFLGALGARRWVAPVEMSRSALAGMMQSRPEGVETEVFVYGRLPLALSARCFTARRFNLQKDDCQFRCLDHPEGLTLRTREGQPFLVLNGIQTQSARVCNLVRELPEMARLGVDIVRISPQSAHIAEIAARFKRVLLNPGEVVTVAAQLDGLTAGETCNGYWHGAAGIERVLVNPP
jgi:collagenase-like PrtC family protease